jgi:hypothetical protein
MSKTRTPLNRRTLLGVTGTAGAIAAVATALPRVTPTAEAVAPVPKVLPEKGGGYTLSEHVKRYYGTTRI